MTATEPKVFTMTVAVNIFKSQPDSAVNLNHLNEFAYLTDDIVGLKYEWKGERIMKGSYRTTIYKKSKQKDVKRINSRSFYNQISMVVKLDEKKQCNAKLFSNGKMQLTGCRNTIDGVNVTNKVIEYLNELASKTFRKQCTFNNDGAFCFDNTIVSIEEPHTIIGYTSNGEYTINNKKCVFDKDLRMFVTKKTFGCRTHIIFDLNGKESGSMSIKLAKNKKRFYTKNSNVSIENNLVYVNQDHVIGKVNVVVDPNAVTALSSNKLESDKIVCLKGTAFYVNRDIIDKLQNNSEVSDIEVYSVMASWNLMYKLNRQRLLDELARQGYMVRYNPETYSGVYWLFKLPTWTTKPELKGHCPCSSKCTCENVSVIVFQSGNVIASGLRSIEKLRIVYDAVCKWETNHRHLFMTK